MKHFCILLTTLIVTYTYSVAQTPEDSVKAAVNALFDGMKNADAGAIRNAFADSAILQTIGRNKEGQTIIRTDAVSGFAEQISKIQKGAADERITFETVKIDGPLAIVWT
ncbi:MAG: nuclear transport factor 2 family protein, partial [Chitinophagaceae bacterium]